MRTRINNITFTSGTRSINTGITGLTIDDIRLIVNESLNKVICSSMQKSNITNISNGVITYSNSIPVLASGDHITFEVDLGDNCAKLGSNSDVSLTSVDEKIDDIKDTFDADMALQLQGIIGEGDSVEGNSQTEGEIERLRTLQESYDALSRSEIGTELSAGKQQLAAAITEQGVPTLPSVSLSQMAENVGAIVTDHISTEGTEWAGDAPLSLTEALLRTARDLEEIVDDRETPVQWDYAAFCSLKRIHFTNATDLSAITFYNSASVTYGSNTTHAIANLLEEVYAPKAERISGRFAWASTSLRVLYLPHANPASYGTQAIWEGISRCSSLIDLITGEYFTVSTNTLFQWNPTTALLSTSQSLLTPEDIAAGFTSNLEKLLYNIREHIAANLPDMTGQSTLTLTMSANIKAAIQADTATSNAFTNKNWYIA